MLGVAASAEVLVAPEARDGDESGSDDVPPIRNLLMCAAIFSSVMNCLQSGPLEKIQIKSNNNKAANFHII